jgi:hypothetical protein
MPRAVAEHYAEEARRQADPALRLQHELPGVESAEALRTMTPEEVFIRWLYGRSARRQLERLAAEGRIPQQVVANMGFAMHQDVTIGVVADGPQLAHVLHRHNADLENPGSGIANWLATMPADERDLARELWARGHPSVAIVRRQADGTWRFVIEQNFLNRHTSFVFEPRAASQPSEPNASAPEG